MRIFITGGTGFIGRYVLDRLNDHEILLLIHENENPSDLQKDNVKIIQGNLSDIDSWKESVTEFQPESCLHMAWEGIPDFSPEMCMKNLQYGLDIISMLAEIGCRKFVSTGSCWEYGKDQGQLKEDDAVKPKNAFSAAKNCLHWIGREIADEKGMTFIWTRLFYVYGPGQRPESLIPSIIESISNGKDPDIKTPGNKNDFVYVGDVADALGKIIEKADKSEVYNIGSGKSTSVKEIAEIVAEHYKTKIEMKDAGDVDF
ncbi:NAD-dependent epimerase/dehydratase family protein, partial [Candidatus Woesearchaeota archaeon]|nr:NAD-dependent epimerase/dehydratase family protein [Candidatus Woesearchaeota archaeon]